jgi:Na/Pi-cotransporter
MGSLVLLDLLGGVALLLWGLHMVLTGVLRAFGPDLRRLLGKALRNRFTAFGAGLGLTALLQSSTATGLMTTSLAADGMVGLVPALAIMLGANVGTTLIVQLLSFNISAVAPFLFIIGVITFRVGGESLARALGRISIGLGLTLLALHILIDTLAPAEQAPLVRALLASITNDPVLCIVIAAALTWATHSSVAVVLLVMSLAYSHFVSAEAALALVLGANLGSAINPLLEGGTRGDPASRRLPVQSDQSACRHPHRSAVPAAAGARIDRLAARRRQDDGRVPHAVQRGAGADFHRPARRIGLAAGAPFAGAPAAGRPFDAALSRRNRAGNAPDRARQRRARDFAHGRRGRDHAARRDGRADEQRPQARRRGVADG